MTNNNHPSTTRPTWQEFWAEVGSEDWLTALALLELDDHQVLRRDLERFLTYAPSAGWRDAAGVWHRQPELDWDAWVANVEERGRGWSSTEARLFELVAGLTTGRPFNIVNVLGFLGSWELQMWRILTAWGTGGNNRDRASRATVVPS